MNYPTGIAQLTTRSLNRSGFTFLTAIFMVMLIGIMLGLTGQAWKTIMQREREKELLFRGSQIKEAIENWYNPNYKFAGVKQPAPRPLMDLKDLLMNPNALTPMRYLPSSYAAELDAKNPKCGSECPKLKVYQDPITGKEWTLIKGIVAANGTVTPNPGGGIVGVASKSDEAPLKTDFKDTALENMAANSAIFSAPAPSGQMITNPASGGQPVSSQNPSKMEKYSDWKFIAEAQNKNDHAKIYRAYHERW